MGWTLLSSGATGFAVANSSTPFTYTLPGGAPSAGVLEILFVTVDAPLGTPGAGGGAAWTQAEEYGNFADNATWWRVTNGSEGATITIAITGGTNSSSSARFMRWSGQALSSPFDVAAKSANGSGTTSPSISSGALAGTGELVVAFAGLWNASDPSPSGVSWSSGLTDDGNGAAGQAASDWAGSWGAYSTNAGTAAQTAQATWTGGATQTYTQLVAFKPAAASPAPLYVAQKTVRARLPQPHPPAGQVAGDGGGPVQNPGTGPAVFLLRHPARAPVPRNSPRGRTASSPGAPVRNPSPPSLGPVFRQAASPARARTPRVRGGRVASGPGGPVSNPLPLTTYEYIGPYPLYYLDYIDTQTRETLYAVPGNSYSMQVVNSRAGLTVPPPDSRWLGGGMMMDVMLVPEDYHVVLARARAHNAALHARLARGENPG